MAKAKQQRVLEKDLEQAVREYLELDGWRCWHFEEVWAEERKRTFGEAGMPDLLLIRYDCPGTEVEDVRKVVRAEIMWLEVKTDGGRVAPHQKLWHAAERKRGALTIIFGEDFPATFDGFIGWYQDSGLCRRMHVKTR